MVGEVFFWALVAGFFVWVGLLRTRSEESRSVREIRIVVCDSLERQFVTPEKIMELLGELEIVGSGLEEVDLAGINTLVESYSFVSHARSFVDYDGTLTVELYQRKPVVRIISNQGHDFYLSRDMFALPVQPHATLNLPIVTGEIPLPFQAGFSGNIYDKERMEEKNYEENCNFLYKLINFVDLTEQSDEWRGEFVQFRAVGGTQKADKQDFREPSFELTPRRGDYILEIGTVDDAEAKLQRWKTFMEASVVDTKGGVLCVEYDNQVLWKSPKAEKKSKK